MSPLEPPGALSQKPIKLHAAATSSTQYASSTIPTTSGSQPQPSSSSASTFADGYQMQLRGSKNLNGQGNPSDDDFDEDDADDVFSLSQRMIQYLNPDISIDVKSEPMSDDEGAHPVG